VLLSFVGTVWVIAIVVLVAVVATINAWHRLGLGLVGCVQIIGQHAAEIII
jgi:hypothetical protein